MKKYILKIFLLTLIVLGIGTIKCQARIYTNDPTVNSGGNVTITISSQEKVGTYTVAIFSNSGVTFTGVSGPSGVTTERKGANGITGITTAGTNTLAYYTFSVPTVTSDTTYEVVFVSSDLADTNLGTVVSSKATATITVKAPPVSNPSPTPSPKPTPTPVTLTFSSASGTMYTTGSVRFRSHYDTSDNSNIIQTLSKDTEVTITGKATGWYRVTYGGKTGYIASSYLTDKKPEEKPSPEPSTPPSAAPDEQKSNDSSLKSLSIAGVEITPAFDARIFNYDANILDTTVTQVEVLAEANNEKAKYEVIGNTDLKNGENIISVAVTAEDGTVSRYDIKLIIGVVETPSPETTPIVASTTNENTLSKKQIAIIAGIAVVTLLVIILLVRHHRKQDDLDYGETDYSFLKNDEDIQNKEEDRKKEFLDGFSNDDNDEGGSRKGGKHF